MNYAERIILIGKLRRRLGYWPDEAQIRAGAAAHKAEVEFIAERRERRRSTR